jgi:hypothetical protein
MAKQGATKNRGNKKSKGERKRAKAKAEVPVVGPDGDLRLVPLHLQAWKDGRSEEASTVLLQMGRDAAFQVLEAAEAAKDEGLIAFARRLAALPPQVDTNLYTLRAESVAARVSEAAAAPEVGAGGPIRVQGGAVALFDPLRVQDALAKGGRPRRDDARVQAGDVTWLGLPTAGPTEVRLRAGPPPAGQATRRARLKVTSGVIFVGAPEASDGPRLGTVRLDPFHTALDEHLAAGALLRLKGGVYAVHGFLAEDGGLEVYLAPDPDPKATLDVAAATLASVPRA